VSALLDSLMTESDDKRLIEKLAQAEWPTSAAAAKRSLESAEQVGRMLHNTNWDVVRALRTVTDNRKDEAVALLERLRDTAARDELAASLVTELPVIQREAIRLFTVTPPVRPEPEPEPDKGGRVTVRAEEVEEALKQVRQVAQKHAGKRITVTWKVEE
jgi:hypothetical protein